MKPVEDYDELTVEEVKDRVRNDELGAAAALSHERETKDRVTLTDWLENRTPPKGEDAPDPAPADAPERNAVATGDGAPDHPRVTVASQRKGSIAGHVFEASHDTKTVDRTPRVEEAISNGDLRVIES